MTITGEQVKAARQILGWTQSDLGGQTGLSASTIGHFETGKRPLPVRGLSVIKGVLEGAGVEFSENGEAGPGVGLRKGAK
jgi:transcriptional regulator with XRE-family HTH domain